MSTEKIQLPDFAIANLYTDLLVLGNDVANQKYESTPAIENIAAPTIQKPVLPAVKNEPKPAVVVETKPNPPTFAAELLDTSTKQWYLGNNGKI